MTEEKENKDNKNKAVGFRIGILFAVIIIGFFGWNLFLSISNTRGSRQDSMCRSNLRMIGNAIEIYTQDNSGKYPGTLELLIPDYHDPEEFGRKLFYCIEHENEPLKPEKKYIYLHIVEHEPGDKCMIAFCPAGKGEDKYRNILYSNGRVGGLSGVAFKKEVNCILETPELKKKYSRNAIEILQGLWKSE